jgi:hypothetical protein
MADDLVRVLSTSSVPEGEIARSRLEDEGIPVLVKGEGDGPYRMGPVHLYVPAGLEIQARLVLTQSFEEPEPGGEDEDPLEGGELESAFEEDRGSGGGDPG